MPNRHLVLSIALVNAALAVTPALGQQHGTLQVLAEKVCQLGKTAEKDEFFEPMGLNAPFVFVVESMHSAVAVSASTCSNIVPPADRAFLGIRRLVEATAPGAAVFMDYFTISGSGELIVGLRLDLTAKLLIRLDITQPEWRAEVGDVESYWLNKYGLQSR